MQAYKKFLLAVVGLCSSVSFAVPVLNTQWIYPSPRTFEMLPVERTQPVSNGDVVYVGRLNGDVAALDVKSGYALWVKNLPAGVEGALAVARGKIFVGDRGGNFYCLSARDGQEIWKIKAPGEWLSPPAVLRDKIVVVNSNNEVFALNEEDGKEVWHFSHPGDEKMTVRGAGGPVAFAGTDIFIGFSTGKFVSLAASDGKLNWEKVLRTHTRFYDIDGTPYVDDRLVIVPTFDGHVYALNRISGNTEWMLNTGSYGGFLVEEGTVYFLGLDEHFYAIDKTTGGETWKLQLKAKVGATPSRIGNYLMVPTANDPLYLIDPKAKKVAAQYRLGAGSLARATIQNGDTAFVLSNYGNVFNFKLFDLPETAKVARLDILRAPSALGH